MGSLFLCVNREMVYHFAETHVSIEKWYFVVYLLTQGGGGDTMEIYFVFIVIIV